MSTSNHRFGRLEAARAALVVCALFTTGSAFAQPTTTRVSVGPGGAQSNGSSTIPVISGDARWVAFWSYASNLVPNDTNGASDVFLYDRLSSTTTRVSVGPGGAQGNYDSSEVAISADGRFIAFESWADNLVPGDTNARQDIFVHDQWTGTTTRVSVALGGAQGNDNSYLPSISADGRLVTFDSWATNLVAGDTNATADIFAHDRDTGSMTRVSVGSGGAQGNGPSYRPSLSGDGRWVAFWSYASTLVVNDTNGVADVFVHDRQTGTTTRVSVGPGGLQGNSESSVVTINGDGRWVAFQSWANNLVAGDTNARQDVFVHDQQTGATTRVSVGPGSAQGDNSTWVHSISADGRWVTLDSFAITLVSGDTNGTADAFVHDRQTGTTSLVSLGPAGTQGNAGSHRPMISADGRSVVFFSYANNLVPGDTNAVEDVFVHDRAGTIAGVVTNAVTLAPVANTFVSAYSSSGSYVTGTQTNAQGAYILPSLLPTGSYYLVAAPLSASGLVCQLYQNLACPQLQSQVTTGTAVAVTAPNATVNISFALLPTPEPGPFSKSFPAFGAVRQSTSPTLSWGTSFGATSYQYCYDTLNDNACSQWVSTGPSRFVTLVNLRPDTWYYWHVRALNANGTTYSQASATAFWNFSTVKRPPLVDLNGDRKADIFTSDSSTGNWAKQVSQDAGGFLTTLGTWSPGWSVAMAKLDADALTDFFLFNTTTGEWKKMLNNGAGFTTQSSGQWWPGWQRHILDLNGDGVSDLFLYDPASGQWYQCVSTPTGFTYTSSWWSPGWEITPVNLNGDAYGDLFLIDRTTGLWFWVRGNAGGIFTYPKAGYWMPDWALFPGDFNGDGLGDLFLYRPDAGEYYVALNNGTGYTYTSGYGWAAGWTPYVADFDGNSTDDLFLYSATTGAWFEMISDGVGGFSVGGNQTWTTGWHLYSTDFNADGRTDFLLYDPASGSWYQAHNLVTGSFSYSSGFWAPGLTIITGALIR